MVDAAVETFGDLHIVVNNAGILRDRVLANMTEAEWDAVIGVHLKGTFGPARHAVDYWREQAKAGRPVSGRIINTTSVSGIYGNPGQTNYGAAKAGIAAFTTIAALEVARYGVTVNAVAPVALTRMTEGLGRRPRRTRSTTPGRRTGSRPWSRGWPPRRPATSPVASSRPRGASSPSPRAGTGARREPHRRPDEDRRRRPRPPGQGPSQRRHGRPGRLLAAEPALTGVTRRGPPCH